MKKTLALLTLFCFATIITTAQSSLPGLDKSPMDMSYCPSNYPGLGAQGKPTDALTARIIYGRPQKNGRAIFGSLIEYGKVWRLGANESTEIDFFKPVTIDSKKIAEGRYTIYAIPDSAKWTIILNKAADTWGAYTYDKKLDVLRVDVPVQKQTPATEALTIVFEKAAAGANLTVYWDDAKVALPITF